MEILFITAFTPSEIGASVKNTKIMLEKLSCKHSVDLIYFRYAYDTQYTPPNSNVNVCMIWNNSLLFKLINILLCPFFYPQFSVRYNWWYMHKINRLLSKRHYDVILFDHSQLFLYAKFLKCDSKKVLISHDVIAQRAQRAYNVVAYKWCMFSERFCLNIPNSRIFTFSDKDCTLIKSLYGYKSYVSHAYLEKNVIQASPLEIDEEYVMFGMWGRSDNLDGAIWFFDNVAPLLNKRINIKIIGKGFPEKKLMEIHPNIIVEYLGFVDNPYNIIANCKAVLAPIFTGAGLKQKVAESLACGTPVIGTDVALEGLPEECSEWMLLANDDVTFAKYVENIHFSLESRMKLKTQFLDCFDKGRLPDYIDSLSRSV